MLLQALRDSLLGHSPGVTAGARLLLQGCLKLAVYVVVAATAFLSSGCFHGSGISSFPSWMLGSQGKVEIPL